MPSKLMEDLDTIIEERDRLVTENGLLRKGLEAQKQRNYRNVSRLVKLQAIVERLEYGLVTLSEFHAELVEFKEWSKELHDY